MKVFLYYSIPPEKPRLAGELRLRVVSSDDHASFESGSDLLLTNGRAWTRPLYALSKLEHILPLYEKLREDRFVPDDLHAPLSTFPSKLRGFRRCQYFYTLNDPLIVDFSSTASDFFVFTEKGAENLDLLCMFYDNRVVYEKSPYTGTYTIRLKLLY